MLDFRILYMYASFGFAADAGEPDALRSCPGSDRSMLLNKKSFPSSLSAWWILILLGLAWGPPMNRRAYAAHCAKRSPSVLGHSVSGAVGSGCGTCLHWAGKCVLCRPNRPPRSTSS